MKPGTGVATAAALFVLAAQAAGYSFAPVLLHAREIRRGTFEVRWERMGPDRNRPLPAVELLEPVFPARCRARVRRGPWVTETSARWLVECGEKGLAGAVLRVRGIETSPINVVVRVEPLDGHPLTGVIHRTSPRFEVPEMAGGTPKREAYFRLGVEHIARGLDHLLFLACLLFLARRLAALLKTITAFTAAHSITLALAVLGKVAFSQKAVDAAIAASIVLLAAEIARGEEGNATTLTHRQPWLVAFAFGLLHGLGFAGALRDFGLPTAHLPAALLFFNLGVEAGQLLFVVLLWRVLRAADRLPRTARHVCVQAPIYAVGAIAFAWTAQRLGAVFGIG